MPRISTIFALAATCLSLSGAMPTSGSTPSLTRRQDSIANICDSTPDALCTAGSVQKIIDFLNQNPSQAVEGELNWAEIDSEFDIADGSSQPCYLYGRSNFDEPIASNFSLISSALSEMQSYCGGAGPWSGTTLANGDPNGHANFELVVTERDNIAGTSQSLE